MSQGICNPQHLGQITHIETNTNTLLCANDIPQFTASGGKIVPIDEYANEAAEAVKTLCLNTHALLAKLETTKTKGSKLEIEEKINYMFQRYVEYIMRVKEKLIYRLTRSNVYSNSGLANEFCNFAEQTSLANINLKKAILNKDYMEIRRYCHRPSIYQIQEKYNYFAQSLFSNTGSPTSSGFDVIFKDPTPDPDIVLNQVGVSLVGYQAASLKQSLFSSTQGSVSPIIPNPIQESLNQVPVVLTTPPRIDQSLIALSPNKPKLDPSSTLHIYDKMSKKFIFYSLHLQKIFTIPAPILPSFPYDGCFPSKYFNNQLFFCGGQDEQVLIKSTFNLDLSNGSIKKLHDLNHERSCHSIEEALGKIIAMGGKTTKTETNSCEMYHPSNDIWDNIAPLNYTRYSAVSFTFNNTIVYIIGGNANESDNSKIEKMNTSESPLKWNSISFINSINFNLPVQCANSCDFGGGNFIIFGGFSEKNMLTSCIYNANKDTIESGFYLSSKYFIYNNKSPALFIEGKVFAINDEFKIHTFSIQQSNWSICEAKFETQNFNENLNKA